MANLIADLRAFSVPDGQQPIKQSVFILGNLAVDDGGAGIYWWDSASTEADDGLEYIKPTDRTVAGRWRLINPNAGTGGGGTGDVPSTRSLTGTMSVAGGGDLSANRTFSLVNDMSSPGAWRVYGTDGNGARLWKADPTGGSASPTTITRVNTVALAKTQVDPSQFTAMWVLGLTVIDDGGGGFYVWDSTSADVADDAYFIQSSFTGTGRWRRITRNVDLYAISLGTTADTATAGNDDRIPDATEQAFLATINTVPGLQTPAMTNYKITPENNAGVLINSNSLARQPGLQVYAGAIQPEQSLYDAYVFLGGPHLDSSGVQQAETNLYVLSVQAMQPQGNLTELKNLSGEILYRTRTVGTSNLSENEYVYNMAEVTPSTTRREVYHHISSNTAGVYRSDWVYQDGTVAANTTSPLFNVAQRDANAFVNFIGNVTITGTLRVVGTIVVTDGINTTTISGTSVVHG